jgi:predicted HTH transcriptional regulator
MNYIYVLILGFLAGFLAAWIVKKNKTVAADDQSQEMQKNLDKIMGLAATGEITNDQIQQSLGIGDSTTTKYCDILERQGKLVQVGRTGKFVTYKKP